MKMGGFGTEGRWAACCLKGTLAQYPHLSEPQLSYLEAWFRHACLLGFQRNRER